MSLRRNCRKSRLHHELDVLAGYVRARWIDHALWELRPTGKNAEKLRKYENLASAFVDVITAVRDCADVRHQRRFLFTIMKTPDFRQAVSWRTRWEYRAHILIAAVYADGESLVERLGCLLPQRERDALIGDAIEAIDRVRSLSIGKPKRRLVVFGVTMCWAAIIAKNAALFAVSSQLPRRSR